MDLRSSETYEDLRYNPFSVPLGRNILSNYKELMIYPEFQHERIGTITINRIVRYVMLVYQKGSPLLRENNINKRKIEAANLVEFPKKKGSDEFVWDVEQIMTCKEKDSNKLILRFLRLQHDDLWAQVTIYEESRQAQYEKLLNDQFRGVETASKVKSYISEVTDEIDKLRAKIFNDDMSRDLTRLLYESVSIELMCPRSEDIAVAIKNNELDKFLPNWYYENI